MNGMPMPICLWYCDPVTHIREVIDSQNRLCAIQEYIEQTPTGGPFDPLSYILLTEDADGLPVEEHVFYRNRLTHDAMEAYCADRNARVLGKRLRVGNPTLKFRLMTDDECGNFDDYSISVTIIVSQLDRHELKALFMRWQNGTPIIASDKLKNQDAEFPNYFRARGLGQGRLMELTKATIFHRGDAFNMLIHFFRLMEAINGENEDARFQWVRSTLALEKVIVQQKYTMRPETFDGRVVLVQRLLETVARLDLGQPLKFGMVLTLAGIYGESSHLEKVAKAYDDEEFLRHMVTHYMLQKGGQFKFNAVASTRDCHEFVDTYLLWKAKFMEELAEW